MKWAPDRSPAERFPNRPPDCGCRFPVECDGSGEVACVGCGGDQGCVCVVPDCNGVDYCEGCEECVSLSE
jgi:hypothetical protein